MFMTIPAATAAANKMNGRFFAGRTVTVSFMPQVDYSQRFPEA
jgi:hypothetical protein